MVIINSTVINGNSCSNNDYKNFDETKREAADMVNRIIINSIIDVKVSACDTNDIIAHLHGSAITSNNTELSVTRHRHEIRISAQTNKRSNDNMSMIFQNSVIVGNFSFCSNANLMLDIQIPRKVFERISIESEHGKIAIDSAVKSNSITAKSTSGNINVSAVFHDLIVESEQGKITIDSTVKSNSITAKSTSGNINVLTDFQDLIVESKQGKITIDSAVKSNSIDAKSTSGNINVSAVFHDLIVESEQGTITIDSTVKSNSITAKSTSGNINVSADFRNLITETVHGKITINSTDKSNSITAKSTSGNINVSADFQDLIAKTVHGNVYIASEAYCDVKLNVDITTGNADVTIGNIRTSTVLVSSKTGKCKNNPKLSGIHTVSGFIKSQNGNIKFQ